MSCLTKKAFLKEKNKFREVIRKALFKFSINCLLQYTTITKTNIAFSPLSLYEGLYAIYLLSTIDVKQRLKRILYLTNCKICDYISFDIYGDSVVPRKDEKLTEFSPDYENDTMCYTSMNEYFAAALQGRVSLSGGMDAPGILNVSNIVDEINKSIKQATDERIRDPLKLIRENMDIVLINTLQLKVEVFETTNCESEASSESTVNDKRKCKYYYCNELHMLVCEFAYEKSDVSLFALLPFSLDDTGNMKKKEESDLRNLIQRLLTDDGTRILRNLLDDTNLVENFKTFSFKPVFEIEKNLKVTELLAVLGLNELSMGVTILLDIRCGCPGKKETAHLDNVAHRVGVKVTDKQTIAGAVTVCHTGRMAPETSRVVEVNPRIPFVWLIYDRLHHHILFIGTFN